MLIIGTSGSGKTNTLINLIKKDSNNLIGKIYLYAKNLDEPKYQFLIKKRENAGLKNLNDSNAFIEYSNTMDDFYNTTDGYNQRKRKNLIVLDDTIADIMTNKKFIY